MKNLVFCFALILIFSPSAYAEESKPQELKEVLIGRKDLIRNEALKINSNLCQSVLNAHNGQFQSMTNIVNYLKDENAELKRELNECKATKKK